MRGVIPVCVVTGHSPGKEVVVEDLTDRVGKMDIQGPRAARGK